MAKCIRVERIGGTCCFYLATLAQGVGVSICYALTLTPFLLHTFSVYQGIILRMPFIAGATLRFIT